MTDLDVVGRDAALADLDRFVEATERLPGTLALVGEPGIGKTALWRHAVATPRGRSHCVLSCSPVAAETRLSFVALRDLLDGAADTVVESLPTPQRRSLAVALLREDPGSAGLDPGAVAVAFLGTLRTLAAAQPVLVAVDDVQWLDQPTRSVLAFAARRLRTEPVAFLLAMRTQEADAARGLSTGTASRIEVGPLSLGALSTVLRDRLGVWFPRPTLLRIHEVSRGNPFFALEIGAALQRGGHRPAPGEPLPVPADLSELLGARIAQLPPAVREVLLTVAVLVGAENSVTSCDLHVLV